MVKLTKADKEKIQQVQEIEAQLRASANAASQVVGSWLGDGDNDEESAKEGTSAQQSQVASVKARDVFQGRPARLGVGAKFLSHKDMVKGNRGGDQIVGPGVLTAEELRLKRRLTKRGAVGSREDAGGLGGGKRTIQQELGDDADDDDEVDSKSKAFVNSNKATSIADLDLAQSKPQKTHQKESSHSEMSQPFKKKQKKYDTLLDSLIQRRKR
ncbi:hypothetical protein GGI23_004948 [Coemansia sp. RSA 2559]|nr:hypothetical protein GGI23_004948 [Coemansia sp. RSA 2559]KAJ2866057.1 hypothetical protein GGI22_001368 [Coemansia erecta]